MPRPALLFAAPLALLRWSLRPSTLGLRLPPFAVAALALLWWNLLDQVRVEWTVNPQYAFGWAVPFLCLYLAWKRLQPVPAFAAPPQPPARFSPPELALAAACALLLPARLLQVANPQWRLGAWGIALVTLAVTLLTLRLAAGPNLPRRLLFPLLFFLVAVPWPTTLEAPLVQALTRSNAALTIEILNGLGIPALQHGNLIELGPGPLGLDEACSGIRSFQATLMLSLFCGELYRLTPVQRLQALLAGLALAFFFNLVRTTLLAWVAVRHGLPALTQWHDPAGSIILVACFIGLWLLALTLARRNPAPAPDALPTPVLLNSRPRSASVLLAIATWLILVNVAVELWFRLHERGLPHHSPWTVTVPAATPGLKSLPFPDAQKRALRYSEAVNTAWPGPGPIRWQVIFLRWAPGRIAAHLAQGHTPDLCLPASGRTLAAAPRLIHFDLHGLRLPFRVYSLADGPEPLHVFYCLWQDRARDQSFQSRDLFSLSGRLAGIWSGSRNLGQRSLELAVWGIDDPAQAEAAARSQLQSLIQLQL